MKPWQVGVLVVVGGIAGGLVVKVTERSRPPAPAVAAAPAPAPVVQPAPAPDQPDAAPAPVAPSQASSKPKPFHSEKPAPKPQPAPVASDPAPAAAAAPSVPLPTPAAPVQTAAAEVAPPAPAPAEAVLPPAPPPPRQVTLNAGTLIPVRLIDGLTTERNHPGDLFTGTLDQPLVVEGLVIAERGARVEGLVVNADPGGKTRGVAALSVQLTRIHLSDGQTISVATDNFEHKAEATHTTDAAKVGGGAIIGAVIGAIAGGGKGAAIGAGVGGGAGAGDVLLTRGKPAALPSETKISFRLSMPVTVTERR